MSENTSDNTSEQTSDNVFTDLEIDNLPNRLTLFRVALVPFVVGILFLTGSDIEYIAPYRVTLEWIAGWSFVVASITDFFDGYIARKRGISTVFGSFLDPIADKFLVVSSLIMLLSLNRIPSIIVVILILRELYMTSLRLLAQNEGVVVPVNDWGKWKTAAQMTGIPMIMANNPLFGIPIQVLGPIFVYISSILSLWSALVYSINLVKKLKQVRIEKREQKRKLKQELKKEKKEKNNGQK